MTKPKVGVFHPGTQHAWQTALAFQETDRLSWFATSVFYDPARWPYRIERLVPQALSERLHRDFARRHLPALQLKNIRQFGLWEWIETGARRLGAARFSDWANRRGNESFGKLVIELVKREPIDVLWGYNTSSLEAFRWAKHRGIRCVLDQTIGHCASMNRVMLAEQARNPEFFLKSYEPSSADVIAQQNEELALADNVVVGSQFCARTLIENGCPRSKICIIPYGFDETLFPIERPNRRSLDGRPTRFLFVGALHPRKGIAALLQAFERIPQEDASLTLVGELQIPKATFQKYAGRVSHYPSLPRGDVVRHYLEADCLIFPSLFEGSALVLNEAIGAGLGLIQSASAGDGVQPGQNGEILDAATASSVYSAISAVIADRARLSAWQEASWALRGHRTWRRYREDIRGLFKRVPPSSL